jgi:hypothetical protein
MLGRSKMQGRLWTLTLAAAVAAAAPAFTDEERLAAFRYWNEPGRYVVSAPPDVAKTGPWAVRLTAEGSTWLWNYNRARGLAKTPPGQVPGAQSAPEQEYEAWIEAKVAWDRWQAEQFARQANAAATGARPAAATPPPPLPGPIPEGLLQLAGNPPPFASAVTPMRHVVKFDCGMEIAYQDNPPMRPRFAFYRFPQGVMVGGQPVRTMPPRDLDALLKEAGITEQEGRVFKAVSLLEGGFESVNTYDTGFLSVGFIQFATLSGGAGSLGAVLQRMAKDSPREYQESFRRFGVDVTEQGALRVVDPATTAVLVGPDAVRKIIDDKRLTAVFQRAGLQSRPFRVAQLRVAKQQYYPADDAVSVVVDGRIVVGKVRDFVRSDAGLATLMDRKVNTGRVDPLTEVATRFANELKVKSLGDLAPFERELIAALRYRKDYLADASLGQPADAPRRTNDAELGSRGGARSGRGGGR